MDLMNKVFRLYLEKFVLVFINDILIWSKNDEEYVEHLTIVLQTLRKHQLCAKFQKWKFWLNEMTFLDQVGLKESIEVDPHMIKAIMKWPRPTTITEVWSFLGMAGYYWRFVQDFSKITLPLTNLLKKTTNFERPE